MVAPDIAALVDRALEGEPAAVEGLVRKIQDDIYGLALRMLGDRMAAEDATQEILLQVLTHLSQWRREAQLSTWVHRIAVRHLMRARRTRMEEMCSFDALADLCALGESNPPLPQVSEAELVVLERELRLICTEGMLLSLDRDHRVAWILDEVFGVTSDQAAEILEIEPAAFRKRVQRSRERLGAWMNANCGLVGAKTRCHCRRQIPVGIQVGAVQPGALQFANHPERSRQQKRRLDVVQQEADLLERAANVLCAHPDYAAPEAVLEGIRQIVSSDKWRLFDA
jgi:RNA polymerase sigma factor (sigma-70 family)